MMTPSSSDDVLGERRHPSAASAQIELPIVSGGSLRSEEYIMSVDHPGRSMEPINHNHQIFTQSSTIRRCITFQNFCFCIQFVNFMLVCALIALAVQEYPKIEQLEQQVESDKSDIANLEDEVREKQEGQIQALNQEVKDEQQFNFLTLAGILSLITCLISVFHISTHLQKMNQPIIQRKIIAILWMSPLYSVTAFFTLWFPSIGGWMAIIKDFYEAYCIYTFLSFLIVVLGEGSREHAVEALAKHASHLEQPTRCLSRFYNPPPDVSDHAKANAVITECQIYGMQFTFFRPLTTIIFVILNRGKERKSNGQSDSSSNSDIDMASNGDFSNHEHGDNTAMTFPTTSSSNHTGSRVLRHKPHHSDISLSSRWLQHQDVDGSSASSNSTDVSGTNTVGTASPSDAWSTWIPSPSPIAGAFAATFAPSLVSSVVTTIVPTIVGHITGNSTSGDKSVGNEPSMAPTSGQQASFVQSTEAYFKSPGFALAMVVNVSVFFAFTGLLKFYHAVRDDLAWIRPWPKFLTIKGVVFLTFWQGLAILIFVVVLADANEKEFATSRALQYQNMLICLEMLFFSISHWVSVGIEFLNGTNGSSLPSHESFLFVEITVRFPR
jgi:hypothetical protein